MNDKDRNGYLDDLLDRSLARYGQVEPRAGLEDRLLVQVRSVKQAQPRRWTWAWYLAPAAAAAAALLFMVIPWREGEPAHSGTPVAAVESPTSDVPSEETVAKPPVATVELPAGRASSVETIARQPIALRDLPLEHSASAMARKRARSVVLTAETSRPRRDIFPTPEPLSDMDRILLRLLRDSSPAAAEALNRLPTADQALEKIQIAELLTSPITLEPIAIASLETEK